MAEYIEREAALDIFGEGPLWTGYFEHYPLEVHLAVVGVARLIREEIGKIPAADVAPVVHGHWDCIPNQYMAVASKDGKYFGNATVCSVCHEVNPNAYKTNYCPNCGAKIDGGSDE